MFLTIHQSVHMSHAHTTITMWIHSVSYEMSSALIT